MQVRKAGFTLVELSIVLVVLGLLVGGVVAGKSLLRAAKLRSITTEASNYQVALDTFFDKYASLPGDMPNAVAFWGAAAGDDHAIGVDNACNAVTTAATGTETCNGDGDGLITPDENEWFRTWQQLANAGIIAGSYAGVPSPDWSSVPGYNVPASAWKPGGWLFWGLGKNADTYSFVAADYGNALMFGGTVIGDTMLLTPVINAIDSQAIDAKIDDGKPATGTVLSMSEYYTPRCVTPHNASYDVTQTNPGCLLLFRRLNHEKHQ